MNLHLLGGFLGSGKITAIIGAAKLLAASGKKVGIITNDQGKFLVDTAFIRSKNFPVTEVSGGCFCCNFDDFTSHIDQIIAADQPDVLFAESVGSCADLVATVIKPLLLYHPSQTTPTSFSVFADGRLLEHTLRGEELPFSEEVTYIFNQQIEESGLLVINKADLLSPASKKMIIESAQKKYPLKQVILQNSQNVAQVKKWLTCLESGKAVLPDRSLNLDYQRYSIGEANLAWLDANVQFNVPAQYNKLVVFNILKEITTTIQNEANSIGHLKYVIRMQDKKAVKLSFTSLDDLTFFIQSADKMLKIIQGNHTEMVINVRVEGNAVELESLFRETIEKEVRQVGGDIPLMQISSFYPPRPVPTHHINN